MKRTSRIVAIMCTFSTLFMGCYTSFFAEPTVSEKQEPEPVKVKSVVTKDGTVYRFDPPAMADSTAIIGVVNGKQVSIPLSDVESVTTSSGPYKAMNVPLIVVGAIGMYVLVSWAINGFGPLFDIEVF